MPHKTMAATNAAMAKATTDLFSRPAIGVWTAELMLVVSADAPECAQLVQVEAQAGAASG